MITIPILMFDAVVLLHIIVSIKIINRLTENVHNLENWVGFLLTGEIGKFPTIPKDDTRKHKKG